MYIPNYFHRNALIITMYVYNIQASVVLILYNLSSINNFYLNNTYLTQTMLRKLYVILKTTCSYFELYRVDINY